MKNPSQAKSHLFLLFAAGLLVRLVTGYFYAGHETDMACFAAWAERMYTYGPGQFYSTDIFTDYPPGYMYILYCIGALRSLLQLPYYSGAHLLLLKLPAILCDLLCGFLLYRESDRRHVHSAGLLPAGLYLFNPAVILNSSVWGQVDSVYTLCVVLMCLALSKRTFFIAGLCLSFGALIKPQMLIFTPVLLAALADRIFVHKVSGRTLLLDLCQLAGAAFCAFLAAFPFGIGKVLSQYTDTLSSYPYASVNAYNLWSLLGLNWVSQDSTVLFFNVKTWGMIAILLTVFFTFLLNLRLNKNPHKYFLLGAFIILSVFTFSARMHERYLYPGMLLLLFACLQNAKYCFCYIGLSILHLANTAHVLFGYDPQTYDTKGPVVLLISGGILICVLCFYRLIFSDPSPQKSDTPKPISFLRPIPPRPSAAKISFTRWDALLLAVIMLLYSLFALHDLGNLSAPVTEHQMTQHETISLSFPKNNFPSNLSYYIGPKENRSFYLEILTKDGTTSVAERIQLNKVFTWQKITLPEHGNTLRLTLLDTQASLFELVFTDQDGQLTLPENAPEYSALFDEQHLFPPLSTYRDSMYFDEIYHGRTAYEFLNGLTAYENTHPPLGKILISLGIAVFGMNPFGWRIVGTLFGIAMLPFLYLFGKKITNSTAGGAFACFLFAFDFMHFTQTRIATIDVFVTFFVILMYYFMFQYCHMSFYDTPLGKTLLPLGASGIAMGLGIACKWTGAYAGAGLAILFFGVLIQRYREYLWAKAMHADNEHTTSRSDSPAFSRGPDLHTKKALYISEKFTANTLKTLCFCLLFFVAIPLVIYLLSYLPFRDGTDAGLFTRMLRNQEAMLSYHSNLNAEHYFSSSWWEWPVMLRPVWYYSAIISDTAELSIREGISAFGNPLVWWAGIPAALYMFYLAYKKKDRTAVFLLIGYLAQYLPWFFVTRITFLYHYFPSVAFVVLMITYSLLQLRHRTTSRKFLLLPVLYAATAFILFLLFYPVLSGQPVSTAYVDHWLRWLDSWVLVAP